MGNLFAELQEEKEKQRKAVNQLPIPATPKKPVQKPETIDLEALPPLPTHAVTQKPTQMSKRLSKPLSKKISKAPTTEEIENLAFRLRKITRARVNADIPQEWKERLDDLAHQLKVGKYDLLLYIIAQFLDEAETTT